MSAASQRSNPADDAASGISDAAKSGGRGGAARTASRQSQGSGGGGGSRVNFPASRPAAAAGRRRGGAAAEDAPSRPFRMPADNDIFALRDQERRRKKQERERQKGLRVHEKVPKKSSISFRQAALLEAGPDGSERSLVSAEDPTHTMAMFLLSYSLGVKRDEMRKLEEVAAAEEKKLEMAEQYLEEDASMFDEFLKENNKNSAEAIRIADEEAKAKLQKVNEIKRLNAQLTQMKSEITKFEEQLREYLAYKEFLERLMPEEERQRRRARKEAKAAAKAATATSAAPGAADRGEDGREPGQQGQQGGPGVHQGVGGSGRQQLAAEGEDRHLAEDENSRAALERFLAEVESDDEEVDLELYFSKPQELLQIFTELEESKPEPHPELPGVRGDPGGAARQLQPDPQPPDGQGDQDAQRANRQASTSPSSARESKARGRWRSSASCSHSGSWTQRNRRRCCQSLNGKVEEVYRACFGDNERQHQMLTDIENRIEYLPWSCWPPELVEAAQKSKDKERRLKAREDKKEQERLRQEERVRRALERSRRSLQEKDDGENERLNREEEEMQYFFNLRPHLRPRCVTLEAGRDFAVSM
uniref:DUF4200 domain-containing protein n=1 Tax=Macrostomum lignano TaxID=282301 RepID=A0A1I8H8W7_9PLAT